MFFIAVIAQTDEIAPGAEERYLGFACVGALTALALHSFVDFNLYNPANTLLLAWITGIIEGRRFTDGPVPRLRFGRRSPLPTYIEATTIPAR